LILVKIRFNNKIACASPSGLLNEKSQKNKNINVDCGGDGRGAGVVGAERDHLGQGRLLLTIVSNLNRSGKRELLLD